jgi:hypothetical protein
MKPAKRRRNPPKRPDDTGNTANKRPKAADRSQSKIKQDRIGPAMPLLTAISQIQTLGKT